MSKNIITIIFTLIISILYSGCDNAIRQEISTYESPQQTNPSTERFETGYMEFGLGIASEQDYSNIICYSESEQYHSNVEKINVIIKNQNPGKGFYYYAIPYIEKKVDEEWIRLNYNEMAQETFSTERDWWEFCGIQDNDTIPYSTRITLSSEDLEKELTSGDYRMVIFVGKEIKYAPFTILD